ncbi:hypothetical protein [Clostridium botulinum]|nr:hypothetical protein [Clostridium botulinum]KEI01327.1 hypothetical protein Y848_09640 [Clostridium botulinum C/D str. Sp77]KEI02912.1 hypothetical protein Z953_05510 [Clostridium botulinum D str. 16868]
MNEVLDFNALIDALSECCLGENVCKCCKNEKCLIGYCRKNLVTSLKKDVTIIDGAMRDIPLCDTKVFDENSVIDAIGLILCQCRNCNKYHNENCIVNLFRSTCEVILLGNPHDYEGSVLTYIKSIREINDEIGSKIYDSYLRHKK